jgi:hypothetical protein
VSINVAIDQPIHTSSPILREIVETLPAVCAVRTILLLPTILAVLVRYDCPERSWMARVWIDRRGLIVGVSSAGLDPHHAMSKAKKHI